MSQLEVMQSLLASLMASPEPNFWERLPPQNRFAIGSAYFLLDGDEQKGVHSFITYTLGRLLQQLNHSTRQQQVEYKGRVRGRVVWSATFKARYSQDFDPTIYTCREVQHYYDTPENQLLKYVVEKIAQCIKMVPPSIRTGFCCYLASKQSNSLTSKIGLETIESLMLLEEMEAALNNFRHNPRLRNITSIQHLTQMHLLRAENARMEEYNSVASIYKRYQTIVESGNWNEMKQIGRRSLLLPGQVNEESDLWIQLGALILKT